MWTDGQCLLVRHWIFGCCVVFGCAVFCFCFLVFCFSHSFFFFARPFLFFGTSPNWKLRMEYRRDESTSEHKFDPTSTINVRIETIEELSKKVEGKYSGEAAAILDWCTVEYYCCWTLTLCFFFVVFYPFLPPLPLPLPLVVGYCTLNVFCKPGTKDPPENPTQLEFVLNKGAHQIPVYYGAPDQKSEWSLHNLGKFHILYK